MGGLSLAPEHRLRARPDFVACYKEGRRYFSQNFIFFARPTTGKWRFGAAVSKKIGSAVRRNRVKRLVREFFRLNQGAVTKNMDFVVVPKAGADVKKLNYLTVEEELTRLLHKALEDAAQNIM